MKPSVNEDSRGRLLSSTKCKIDSSHALVRGVSGCTIGTVTSEMVGRRSASVNQLIVSFDLVSIHNKTFCEGNATKRCSLSLKQKLCPHWLNCRSWEGLEETVPNCAACLKDLDGSILSVLQINRAPRAPCSVQGKICLGYGSLLVRGSSEAIPRQLLLAAKLTVQGIDGTG